MIHADLSTLQMNRRSTRGKRPSGWRIAPIAVIAGLSAACTITGDELHPELVNETRARADGEEAPDATATDGALARANGVAPVASEGELDAPGASTGAALEEESSSSAERLASAGLSMSGSQAEPVAAPSAPDAAESGIDDARADDSPQADSTSAPDAAAPASGESNPNDSAATDSTNAEPAQPSSPEAESNPDSDLGAVETAPPPPAEGEPPSEPADCAAGLGAFPEPELISVEGVSDELYGPALSPDGLTLYFSAAGGEDGRGELHLARRSSRDELAFGSAVQLESTQSSADEGTPFLSTDALSLYFYSDRSGPAGGADLWWASRAEPAGRFSAPIPLDELNSPEADFAPWLSSDERTIVFASRRAGGLGQADLWVATRPDLATPFDEPRNVSSLNGPDDEGRAVFSADGLTAFFSSNRDGRLDLFRATRSGRNEVFGDVEALDALNADAADRDVELSRDGRELFFGSDRSGSFQIWRSARNCL